MILFKQHGMLSIWSLGGNGKHWCALELLELQLAPRCHQRGGCSRIAPAAPEALEDPGGPDPFTDVGDYLWVQVACHKIPGRSGC